MRDFGRVALAGFAVLAPAPVCCEGSLGLNEVLKAIEREPKLVAEIREAGKGVSGEQFRWAWKP